MALCALMALCLSFPLAAQEATSNAGQQNEPVQQTNIKITGTVVDEDGKPLPGVVVSIKSAEIHALTNRDGAFSITAPNQSSVMAFSCLGYTPQEVEVKERRVWTIILKEAVQEVEDVVVVGFSTQRKENVVSAVTTLRPGQLKGPTSNLTTMLGGQIAGMISYQRSGEPGQDNAEFFVRGLGSFGAGKVDPLILIDGIESTTDDLARLQPDDIKDFSVLKDATASAVYGARGANGVVLVNTKAGEQGTTKFSFRAENSISGNTQNFKLADNITYMQLANDAFLTRTPEGALIYPVSKIEQTKAGADPLLYPNNDWIDQLVKPFTMNQRFNASLSGGGRVARYYISGTYNIDNGVLKNDKMNNFKNNVKAKNYSVRSNIDINLTKTTIGIVRFSAQFNDYSGPIGGGGDTFKSTISTNPVAFPALYPQSYIPTANHLLFGNALAPGTSGLLYTNPYADMVSGYQQSFKSTINVQMEFKQDFGFLVKGLNARVMGYTQRYALSKSRRNYNPFYYYSQETSKGIVLSQWNHGNDGSVGTPGREYLAVQGMDDDDRAVNTSYYGEAMVNYDHTFGGKHAVSGMLVGIIRHKVEGLAPNLQKSLPSRNLGLSGRFTYGFDRRYLVEANFGYNGSERFSMKKRWGFFPSIGAGWVISNEKFFGTDKKVVRNLKLRASYGLIGNDKIGDDEDRFFYISSVNLSNKDRGAAFGDEFKYSLNGVTTDRYGNDLIGWEESRQLNVGLDMNLFGVDLIFEVYRQNRSSILQKRTNIPGTMGLLKEVKANTGKAKSQGVDFSADYKKFFNNSLWINARANFTYAANEYILYDEPTFSANEYYRSKVGYPIKQTWGYVADRLFVDDYEVANSPRQIAGAYPIQAGDIKYRDINGDGVINEADKMAIGFPTTPEINYGFGGSIGYKNFDFSFFFQGSARSSIFIEPKEISPFALQKDKNGKYTGGQNGLLQMVANSHWSENNRDLYAFWPRLSYDQNDNNNQQSTWWMRDGAMLRLKNVELGYNLPLKAAQKIRMSSLRVYFNASNLFVVSKFKLWDPEMGGKGLNYPVQRVFNIGLSLTL